MFASANVYEGIPARLYRSPCEIRRDMLKISKQIKEADEMLSIHNILIEMLSECAEGEPARWIPELEEIVAEARGALDDLTKFNTALDELSCELEETLCRVGSH